MNLAITLSDLNYLDRICTQFWKRTGKILDVEELRGVARLAYLHAKETHQDTHGTKWSTWVYRIVSQDLTDYLRKEQSFRARNAQLEWPDLVLDRHTEDLGEAFRAVAEVVSENLPRFIRHSKSGKRKILSRLLLDAGWSGEQVARSYREIREALS